MEAAADTSDEQLEVLRRRYQAARKAGLTIVEAELFRDSDQDVGQLRRLLEKGATVEQIRAIVL